MDQSAIRIDNLSITATGQFVVTLGTLLQCHCCGTASTEFTIAAPAVPDPAGPIIPAQRDDPAGGGRPEPGE